MSVRLLGLLIAIMASQLAATAHSAVPFTITNPAEGQISFFIRRSSEAGNHFQRYDIAPGATLLYKGARPGTYDIFTRHYLPDGRVVDFGVHRYDLCRSLRRHGSKPFNLELSYNASWKLVYEQSESHQGRRTARYVREVAGDPETAPHIVGYNAPGVLTVSVPITCQPYPAHPPNRKIPPPPPPKS